MSMRMVHDTLPVPVPVRGAVALSPDQSTALRQQQLIAIEAILLAMPPDIGSDDDAFCSSAIGAAAQHARI